MTTLTAVKKGKRVCLASDSLSVFGSRKEESGRHVYKEDKILQIGPNFIGMAGHTSWKLILKEYFSHKKTPRYGKRLIRFLRYLIQRIKI